MILQSGFVIISQLATNLRQKHDNWEENRATELWTRQKNSGSIWENVCALFEAKWDAADWRTAEALMSYARLHSLHYWPNVEMHVHGKNTDPNKTKVYLSPRTSGVYISIVWKGLTAMRVSPTYV